jgi:hypothetical protein
MRINISIPDDLKGDMDAAGDINWSKVAQHAFQAKLAHAVTRSCNAPGWSREAPTHPGYAIGLRLDLTGACSPGPELIKLEEHNGRLAYLRDDGHGTWEGEVDWRAYHYWIYLPDAPKCSSVLTDDALIAEVRRRGLVVPEADARGGA